MSKKPHKHAEIIKAWADGAEIECLLATGLWVKAPRPNWDICYEYRIKPEPKPVLVFSTYIQWDISWQWVNTTSIKKHNLKMIFDGETGKLKSAEVLE